MREGEALSPSLMIQNAVYGHQCWEKCVIFHVTYSKKYNRLWITWYKNVIIWHICQRSRKTKALNRQISDTSCCMKDMILIISLILVRLCFVQKSNVTLKKIVFFDFCVICLTYNFMSTEENSTWWINERNIDLLLLGYMVNLLDRGSYTDGRAVKMLS